MRLATLLALGLVLVLCTGVVHAGPGSPPTEPLSADSLTVGLWHLEEAGGDRLVDSGPRHLVGFVDRSVQSTSGRIGKALSFSGDAEQLVIVPWRPSLSGLQELTIEAWVRLSDATPGGIQTIVAQWTGEPATSSWYFGVVGDKMLTTAELARGSRVGDLEPHQLVFAYVAEQAGTVSTQFFSSDEPILSGAWTHVAVTFDGRSVRFYRDHRPDLSAPEAATLRMAEMTGSPAQIHGTRTPLTIGNACRSVLTVGAGRFSYEPIPGVAFAGEIDELRLSNHVRHDLEGVPSNGR